MLDTLLILGTSVADINRIISNKEFQGKKNEIHVIMRSVFLKLYELFGRRESNKLISKQEGLPTRMHFCPADISWGFQL